MLNPKFLSESRPRRVDVGDGDSDSDHPTGDSRASGNEDAGSDSDSDSKVEMTDAEDLDLEEAVFDKNTFEMLLMGSQQPGVFEDATFLSVTWTLLCAQFSERGGGSEGTARCSRGEQEIFQNPGASNSTGRSDAWLSSDQLWPQIVLLYST